MSTILYKNSKKLTISILLLILVLIPINLFAQLDSRILNTLNRVVKTGADDQKSFRIEETSQEALSDSMLYGTLAEIKNAPAPFVYGKYFVFVYTKNSSTDRVFIAFEHEMYAQLHAMIKLETNQNVLVYLLPRTHEDQQINYRLVINSMWTIDPYNPKLQVDTRGVQISTAFIPKVSPLFLPPVVKIDDETVRFYLYVKNSYLPIRDTQRNLIDLYDGNIIISDIFLVGSFTNWDPYAIKLKNTDDPLLYYADVPIKKGIQYYYYNAGFVDFLDPQNETITKRRGLSNTYVNSFEMIPSFMETTGETTFVISTTNTGQNR